MLVESRMGQGHIHKQLGVRQTQRVPHLFGVTTMYEQAIAKQAAMVGSPLVNSLDQNPTVEENIDRKIDYLQGEIDRLQKSKQDLAPLLKMRIRDIRQAMDY